MSNIPRNSKVVCRMSLEFINWTTVTHRYLKLSRKVFAACVLVSRTDLDHHHSCQEFRSIAADNVAAAGRLPLKVAWIAMGCL